VRVAFTRRARREIERIARWWSTNREASPGVFLGAIESAVDLLETSPEGGAPYRTRQGELVRRIPLPGTPYLVYYVVDRSEDIVLVVSVWSSARGRGPALR
jgi:plasmid stabilization system protein ParE